VLQTQFATVDHRSVLNKSVLGLNWHSNTQEQKMADISVVC